MRKKLEEDRLEIVKEALRHWDPIGVIDLSEKDSVTDNEYDSYAPGVLAFLGRGKNAKGIANHLAELRRVSMCLSGKWHTEREVEIGEKLVAWRDSGYREKTRF